jgi:hypothetical protein
MLERRREACLGHSLGTAAGRLLPTALLGGGRVVGEADLLLRTPALQLRLHTAAPASLGGLELAPPRPPAHIIGSQWVQIPGHGDPISAPPGRDHRQTPASPCPRGSRGAAALTLRRCPLRR